MTGKQVFGTVDPDKFTRNENKSALEAINIIKYRGYGRIKGRKCVAGSNQRTYLKYGETVAPPTV